MMYDEDVKIFWLPLMVLFSVMLDAATAPVPESTGVLDRLEEALHRPRHTPSITRIDDLTASKLRRGSVPEEVKSRVRVRVRPQAFGLTPPTRKIRRLATDRPPSPEEH